MKTLLQYFAIAIGMTSLGMSAIVAGIAQASEIASRADWVAEYQPEGFNLESPETEVISQADTTDEMETDEMETEGITDSPITDPATDPAEPLPDDSLIDPTADPILDETLTDPTSEPADALPDESPDSPVTDPVDPINEGTETPITPGTSPEITPGSPSETLETPGMETDDPMETPAPSPEGTETSPSVEPPADSSPDSGTPDLSSMSLVDVAANSQSFATLAQAIQSAGLAETLSGEGPYTVFAPTDEAFAELPSGALEMLLQPENQSLLQQVLQYHVVAGELLASEITDGGLDTLNGGLAVRVADDGRVIVNDASVVEPDIQASNGVIHAVNRVLLSPPLRDEVTARLNAQTAP